MTIDEYLEQLRSTGDRAEVQMKSGRYHLDCNVVALDLEASTVELLRHRSNTGQQPQTVVVDIEAIESIVFATA